MEYYAKKRNIVNNLRWLLNDMSLKASNSMRLWRKDRVCRKHKLILGGKYLELVQLYNTLDAEMVFCATIVIPTDMDPAVDQIDITIGTDVFTYTAGTVTTVNQVRVWLWETISAGLTYNATIDLDSNILYLYNFDPTLEFVMISTELNSIAYDGAVLTADTNSTIVESWNELSLDEVYTLTKEVVKLREINPKNC